MSIERDISYCEADQATDLQPLIDTIVHSAYHSDRTSFLSNPKAVRVIFMLMMLLLIMDALIGKLETIKRIRTQGPIERLIKQVVFSLFALFTILYLIQESKKGMFKLKRA